MERNYNNLMKEKTNSKEYHLLEIRYFGSVLLVLGQILVIYYLLNTESYNGSPI
jgi:hypothetical protein